jgi:hypothetical protein
MTKIRTLIWAYMWLLIFEGAVRKWIAPALDAPMLVIRDPIVLWIYYEAVRERISFNNAFFYPNIVLGVCATVLSTIFGYGNIFVTVYGITVDFLQVPLIFLLPQVLNRNDVVAIGKFLMLVSIPMCMLVVFQFKSSPDSLVNKGAFHTWYGTVRPSGTFSFIAGLVAYYCLTVPFLFYGYVQKGQYKVWLISIVTCDVLLTAAVSGSRTFLISIGIVAIVAISCVVIRGKGGTGMLIAAAIIGLLVPILSTFQVVQDGTDQLTRRFKDGAANNEDASGMANRYAETMLEPLLDAGRAQDTFGNGLGLGTNVASTLLRGQREFIGSEDEWGRIVFESGPIFGVLLIIFRMALTLSIGYCAYRALRQDNFLPMLIFAGCGISILNGQWGVPTSLGFAIIGGGLSLAACVDPPEEDEEYSDEEDGEGEEHHDDEDHAEDESDHLPAGDKAV